MKRRHALMGLAALAAAPRLASAQPAGKAFRIGYLQGSTREQQAHLVKAFVDGLGELGYRDGQNIMIEYRFADAKLERLPALAAELVRLNVDVILTGTNAPTVAAHQITKTIPIVMAFGADPVGAGLIASLARPGGNVTGMTTDPGIEIYGKRLQLLKEIVPKLARVAVLWNPDLRPNQARWNVTAEAARKLGLQTLSMEARSAGDLTAAFAAMVKGSAQALLVFVDPVIFSNREQIGGLAAKHRLPALSELRDHTVAGLLMSYGVDPRERWRRAAGHVAKILKGANPAEMPVEQPTKFELVINGKTAAALGITLSSSMLLQANEVIE